MFANDVYSLSLILQTTKNFTYRIIIKNLTWFKDKNEAKLPVKLFRLTCYHFGENTEKVGVCKD